MNFEITHWGIPGEGANLDDPHPESPDCVLVTGNIPGRLD
jgi:hypothetical protein